MVLKYVFYLALVIHKIPTAECIFHIDERTSEHRFLISPEQELNQDNIEMPISLYYSCCFVYTKCVKSDNH